MHLQQGELSVLFLTTEVQVAVTGFSCIHLSHSNASLIESLYFLFVRNGEDQGNSNIS